MKHTNLLDEELMRDIASDEAREATFDAAYKRSLASLNEMNDLAFEVNSFLYGVGNLPVRVWTPKDNTWSFDPEEEVLAPFIIDVNLRYSTEEWLLKVVNGHYVLIPEGEPEKTYKMARHAIAEAVLYKINSYNR